MEWTETRNLATSEGERAGRIMAATAEASPELKRLAGGAATGSDAAAYSEFTRVVACVVAEPPLCHRSASDNVVTSTIRSDCYLMERQFPGGIRTR